MSDKPATLFIAMTAEYPGYWGSNKEGPHHAIASACDEGADRQGPFVVYEAYEGCYPSDMGGITYLQEHGEPAVYGVYDAAGTLLGDNLADAAKAAREGFEYDVKSCALSQEWLDKLKQHKS